MKWFNVIRRFFWVPNEIPPPVVVKAKTARRKITKPVDEENGEFDEKTATKMIKEAVNVKANNERRKTKLK